ncbi:cytotoxic translational repressor of toxin-antitoxin stability system [Desulfonatronospira thiodismutans ASO3-1]|uniref:Cytotoxic translational repressor of toxin-antitoxin stability system n=1 Tax=Desulfonatronospira thiodismutans ASO3-1 TaxID=555779 RepID=D6SR03_9BACT|nr:cytotoxic translational repressor of toxin-antitoxin stability system [Desulfonatronospira thiodismutans ASO3-1]
MNKYGVKYHPAVKSEDLPRLGSDIKSWIRRTIEEKLTQAPQEYGLTLYRSAGRNWLK